MRSDGRLRRDGHKAVQGTTTKVLVKPLTHDNNDDFERRTPTWLKIKIIDLETYLDIWQLSESASMIQTRRSTNEMHAAFAVNATFKTKLLSYGLKIFLNPMVFFISFCFSNCQRNTRSPTNANYGKQMIYKIKALWNVATTGIMTFVSWRWEMENSRPARKLHNRKIEKPLGECSCQQRLWHRGELRLLTWPSTERDENDLRWFCDGFQWDHMNWRRRYRRKTMKRAKS